MAPGGGCSLLLMTGTGYEKTACSRAGRVPRMALSALAAVVGVLMKLDRMRAYLLSKPEAVEDFPFGPDARVYKVQGKMFALLAGDDANARVNLKCDPQQAQALRDLFAAVSDGYHMNKKHWNTVQLSGDVPDGELQRQVDQSYALVVKKLPRALRRHLETAYSGQQLGYQELP